MSTAHCADCAAGKHGGPSVGPGTYNDGPGYCACCRMPFPDEIATTQNAWDLLSELEDDVRRARAALEDEREGDFRARVHNISAHARGLDTIVRTW